MKNDKARFSKVFHTIYPRQVVLITTIGKDKAPNVLPIAWSMFVSFNPAIFAFSIAKRRRHSLKLLREVKEFVVNVPTEDLLKEIQYCGSNSGSQVNKFQETDLTPSPAMQVAPPIIEECLGFFECKVIKEVPTGDHVIIVGEILTHYVKEEVITKQGYDLSKVKLVYHRGGNRYAIGFEKQTQA